jgi:hypothetical protein
VKRKALGALMAFAVLCPLASCGDEGGNGESPTARTAGAERRPPPATGPTGPDTTPRRQKKSRGEAEPETRSRKTKQAGTRRQGTRRAEKKKAPSPAIEPRDERNAKRLEQYLSENFGGGQGKKAGWYDHLVRVAVSGSSTTVETDLGDGSGATGLAEEICFSVRGKLPGVTDVVRVTGPQGRVLARCVP